MSNANVKFYQNFQAAVASLETDIEGLSSAPSRQEAIDGVRARIAQLSNELADATEYLPSYDQKTHTEALKSTTEKLDKEVERFAPRPRFQFKARSKPAAAQTRDDRRLPGGPLVSHSTEPAASPHSPSSPSLTSPSTSQTAAPKDYNAALRSSSPSSLVRKPSFSTSKTISLASHTNLHIVLPVSASAATSYGDISDLEACVLDMSAPTKRGDTAFSGLALKGMRRVVVVTGDVEGPVHVTGVRDAVLVVASRQVRIHECERVDFYLHCSSHPIIEDCSGVRFAPIPGCHAPPWSDTHENKWDRVDDFKWLKVDQSPNWSVLPEDERLPADFWADVAGRTGTGVPEILKRAGIISEK